MVSFNNLGSKGRLANQLFQIAATYGQAELNNDLTVCFTNGWKYEQYFNLPPFKAGQCGRNYNEPNYEYTVIPPGDWNLQGYFQSPKYFGSTIPRFKQSYLDQIRHKLPSGDNIAIHIRRGDYVNHEAYAQLPITYYIKALFSISDWQNKNVLLFSDDLGYCRTHFECLPNTHFIQGNEVEHLALMSLCDHHILSNSSYSWWGAYLSKQQNVIYPAEYFRGSYSHKSTRDLWPDNWHKFECEDSRLDCSDLTFTIPVMLDHADRKRNVDLCLCHLQKYIKAPIIIGECKTDGFSYTGEWAKYIKYPYTEFHRTKMLNEMAKVSDTPFIANWDCDVFIPPLQIWLSYELLRAGGQMVYPYDGRFARMDRFPWFKKVESVIDIGITSDAKLSRRDVKESVGGAVCWNKEAFIEYGMENEYMISYAPEDVERYERAFKLGCKIEKVPGVLYHMDHYKGPDSHNMNPHFSKSRALLEKYRAMTSDELRKEVDTFPWRHQYTPGYYERFIESAQRSAREVYASLYGLGLVTGSIIDIGCGLGEWALGNPNYYGVDYGIPKKQLLIPEDHYTDCNLDGHIQFTFGKKFDLCICLEVAEHLKPESGDKLINYLTTLSNTVLFSAAIPGQGGTGHINEQWQTYWADKFHANGFGAEICYPVKDNQNVDMWYRQNMILYRKGATGKVHNFILPEYYEQILLHRDNQIQELSDRCASMQRRLDRLNG